MARPLFLFSLLLLVLVLIPGIGKVVYGSRRWLPLGIMNFQPSELAKLAIACMRPITWCARWT
jgi:cell division protein FtsW